MAAKITVPRQSKIISKRMDKGVWVAIKIYFFAKWPKKLIEIDLCQRVDRLDILDCNWSVAIIYIAFLGPIFQVPSLIKR